ncbi:hypothetical protein [Pedobacter sp. Leaf250]|uniref:hypothetical protein n=1 Tax=Pedobacter sp. Leaf250 TaxID=2876559 RepID=UPI001E3A8E07|nr:hypothetical protein [Pedobacter sp. Leaf250]
MATLYQRFFILLILLLAFAGRSVVYAFPVQKVAKEIIHKSNSNEAEKSESSEKQNTLEEKVKLADLHLNKDLGFDFTKIDIINSHSFNGNFLLAYCHLQVPEQPPK